jgi:maleate cis-trans isomerase
VERLERELGKPAISSASAMMWNALQIASPGTTLAGFGSLLSGKR